MKLPEIEITVKYKGAKETELREIDSPEAAAKVFREMFNDGTFEWTEEFIMLCMNGSDKVVGYYKVSRGGTDSTSADVKVIATIALQTQASYVILCHNHPSGSPTPSDGDRMATQRTGRALAVLGIQLLDHIILTKDSFYSMGEGKEYDFNKV